MKLLATTIALALMAGVANADYYNLEKETEYSTGWGNFNTTDFYTCDIDLTGLFLDGKIWYWKDKIKDHDWDNYENYVSDIYDPENEVSIYSQQKVCLIKAITGNDSPLQIFHSTPITGYEHIFPNYENLNQGFYWMNEPLSIEYDMLHDAYSELEDIVNEDTVELTHALAPNYQANLWITWNKDQTRIIVSTTRYLLVEDPGFEINTDNCELSHQQINIDPLTDYVESGNYQTDFVQNRLQHFVGNLDFLELDENEIRASWCASLDDPETGPILRTTTSLSYIYNPPEQ